MEFILVFLREQFRAEWAVFLAAGIPVTELRAAIPLAFSLGLTPLQAFVLGVLGNIVPIPILLFGLDPVVDWLSSRPILGLDKFFSWLYARTRRKSDKVAKYGALGLVLFTAVPLPTTGAWTACVAASIFRIRFRFAFPAIAGGVLLAGW